MIDPGSIHCRYCKLRGFYKPYEHEKVCLENPSNLPDIVVTHACGHKSEHKPFDSTPEGAAERVAFEKDRACESCWLKNYREAQARRTPEQIAEQRAEARAAHGPGVELVDVISGERYTT